MAIRRLFVISVLLAAGIPAARAQFYTPITEMGRTADVVAFATIDRVLDIRGLVQLRITQTIKGAPASSALTANIDSKCNSGGLRISLCVQLNDGDVGKSGLWFLKSTDGGYEVISRNRGAGVADEVFLPLAATRQPAPAPEKLTEALLGYVVEWFQAECDRGVYPDRAFFSNFPALGDPRPSAQQMIAAVAPLIRSASPSQHAIGLIVALQQDSVEAMNQVLDELASLQSNPRFSEIVFAIGAYPLEKKDPRWLEPLRRLLNFRSEIRGLDVAAAGALYRIGTRETLPMVVELIDSNDAGAQMIALKTLAFRISSADANGNIPPRGTSQPFNTDAIRRHTPGFVSLTTAEYREFWKSWWIENHDRLGLPLIDPGSKRVPAPVAEAPLPYINQNGIVRGDTNRVGIISPGIVVSIYGGGFGPPAGCAGPAKEVCGVKVLLDGQPIVIEHVNGVQINVRIPDAPPVQATGRITVVSGGRISDPAAIRRLP